MQRLLLVRHAHSEHHAHGLSGGWTDTPLSTRGREQAQVVAARCRQWAAERRGVSLVSSDLARAAQTAAEVARILQVPCQLEPALRELNNGAAAGLMQADAALIERPRTEPALDWVPYANAESWRMLRERVWAAMDQFARRSQESAIVVTHANAGIVVIQWWLELCDPCQTRVSFALDPASITELAINAWNERTVIRVNDTSYLS